MINKQTRPMETKEKNLEMLISDFANKKGKNTLVILDDLLSYVIGFFNPLGTSIDGWKYNKDENAKFYKMMCAFFNEMKEHTEHREWYDIWGDLYMSLITKGDRKGQFFTPIDLCDLMADITIREDSLENKGMETRFGKRVTINDCACGSGRCLLAGATKVVEYTKRKPYLCGEDLDDICCKMSAINIAVHGFYGEVVCHDSLTEPDKVRKGYIINETMYPFPTGLPSIRPCNDPKSFMCCTNWLSRIDTKRIEEKVPQKESFEKLNEDVKKKYEQLTLF